jgi:hypothetical protein
MGEIFLLLMGVFLKFTKLVWHFPSPANLICLLLHMIFSPHNGVKGFGVKIRTEYETFMTTTTSYIFT